jgi:hypothetical protein
MDNIPATIWVNPEHAPNYYHFRENIDAVFQNLSGPNSTTGGQGAAYIVHNMAGFFNAINLEGGDPLLPERKLAVGEKIVGTFYAVPNLRDVGSFIGVNSTELYNRIFIIVQSTYPEQYMFVKTSKTDVGKGRARPLILFNLTPEESARAIAKHYHLAYYKGKNGSFLKEFPPPHHRRHPHHPHHPHLKR